MLILPGYCKTSARFGCGLRARSAGHRNAQRCLQGRQIETAATGQQCSLSPIEPRLYRKLLPGLGKVINYEALARELLHELDSYGQMLAIDQEVVGKVKLLQNRNSSQEVRPQQESVVRFALNNVTNTDQLRIANQGFQLRPDIGSLQIKPADDSYKGRGRSRWFETPVRLLP